MTEMFSKTRLFCPGPTPVGHEASLALLNTNVYHRTDDFKERVFACRRGLKPFFGTTQLPLILSASGTGAMEAAVTNLTAEADNVLVLVAGKFGERWEKLAKAFGCNTSTIKVDPGHTPASSQVLAHIKANPSCKAIFLQANETSTGVQLPVETICTDVRGSGFEGLIIVDAVSGMCAHPLEMDKWGIDCLVSGSQKGFGIPPGLAFIALSERGWKKVSKRPRFYFDLEREKKNQDDGQTAFTPATGLILALEASLTKMLSYGPQKVVAHHQRLANACRAACKGLGLQLFAKENPSDALTAMALPSSLNGKKLVSDIKKSDGAIFAGGQDDLAGKIIRMSHLGFVDRLDIIAGIAALEFALKKQGHDFEFGSGVRAGLEHLT